MSWYYRFAIIAPVKTLHRHIQQGFLVTFLATLAVITFVMSIGAVFKVTDLLARGVPWRPIVEIFLLGLPAAVSFAVPVSALTSSLLMFGRLSSDSEIAAMKACGISMWQIVSRPLAVAASLAVVCLYVNSDIAPRSHFAQRSAIARLGIESPLQLLEEGRFIQEFDGLTIFIGKRKGAQLTNVRIYDLRKQGVRREIRARTGTVVTNTVTDLAVHLRDVRVDPFLDDRPGSMYCDVWTLQVPNPLGSMKYRKKNADLTGADLLLGILHVRERYPQLSEDDLAKQKSTLQVELHKRIVLALASFTFVLLGVPLGTRSHRKESSIGIAISLMLTSVFYLFILMAQALNKKPDLQPHLINWIPIVISAILGLYLIHRSN